MLLNVIFAVSLCFLLSWVANDGSIPALLMGEVLLGFIWAALHNHSPLAFRIVMAAPIVFLDSILFLMVTFDPYAAGDSPRGFWQKGGWLNPGRVKLLPNPSHPWAMPVKLFWSAILLIWIVAWDEWIRNDLGRWLTG